MRDLPFFRWYPADCDTDENVRGMSDAELGFYIRCLNHAWINGSLPADPTERARVLRTRKDLADRYWIRVGKCFNTSTDCSTRLTNKRQETERKSATEKSIKCSESVRARYDRIYDRRENVVPRARARPDSDSVHELKNQIPKKGESEGETPEMRAEFDDQWAELQRAVAECGRSWSKPDWQKAHAGQWRFLDFEQKQAAIGGYRTRAGTQDWCLTVAPLVYLRDRLWERTVERPPKRLSRMEEVWARVK